MVRWRQNAWTAEGGYKFHLNVRGFHGSRSCCVGVPAEIDARCDRFSFHLVPGGDCRGRTAACAARVFYRVRCGLGGLLLSCGGRSPGCILWCCGWYRLYDASSACGGILDLQNCREHIIHERPSSLPPPATTLYSYGVRCGCGLPKMSNREPGSKVCHPLVGKEGNTKCRGRCRGRNASGRWISYGDTESSIVRKR